jgi:hypothetical protein
MVKSGKGLSLLCSEANRDQAQLPSETLGQCHELSMEQEISFHSCPLEPAVASIQSFMAFIDHLPMVDHIVPGLGRG